MNSQNIFADLVHVCVGRERKREREESLRRERERRKKKGRENKKSGGKRLKD